MTWNRFKNRASNKNHRRNQARKKARILVSTTSAPNLTPGESHMSLLRCFHSFGPSWGQNSAQVSPKSTWDAPMPQFLLICDGFGHHLSLSISNRLYDCGCCFIFWNLTNVMPFRQCGGRNTKERNQTKLKHRSQNAKRKQQGNIEIQHIQLPAFCEPSAMHQAQRREGQRQAD